MNLKETFPVTGMICSAVRKSYLSCCSKRKKKSDFLEEEQFWFVLYSKFQHKQMGKWSRFIPKSHLSLINSEYCVCGEGPTDGRLCEALTGGVERCTLSFVAFLALFWIYEQLFRSSAPPPHAMWHLFFQPRTATRNWGPPL